MRTGKLLVSQGRHAPSVHDEQSLLSIVERDGAILYTVSIEISSAHRRAIRGSVLRGMDDRRKKQETRFTKDVIITTILTS